jgi:hypothetical protein
MKNNKVLCKPFAKESYTMELMQKFVLPTGEQFDTKAEAQAFLRQPKILAALVIVTGNNKDLADWLLANQDTVEGAFESGTIKRVTKAEAKKLGKAIDALKLIENQPELRFLIDNAEAVRESFRWPSVKRMTEEEKALAARNTLLAATENNEELVTWILGQKDQILASYEAGVEKRAVNPKATEALAAYRLKQAEEKAAKAAAEAAE